MKEFDFDELDKAVNSLMGGAQKPVTEPSQATPGMTPASLVVEEAPTPPPVVSTPLPLSPVAEDITTPAPAQIPTPPAPSTLVPPRQSGRFMDVVHPSADMKTPPSAPSREGLTLQPTQRSTPEVPPVSSPTRPVIDVMAPVPAQPVTIPTPPPVEATDAGELPKEPTPAELWVSPFLPDAQVEKRPLGGAPASPSAPDLSQAMATELSAPSLTQPASINKETAGDLEVISLKGSEDATKPEAPKESVSTPKATHLDDKQLAPVSEPAPLPAELNSDLVAIESGQLEAITNTEHSLPREPEPTIQSTSSLASHTMSTASIPQQYNEQPSTGDESHTPIYDNESAHHPLTHPAKKKSGWMLVVFIVIILVLGGALGAAAYFFGLI